MIEVPVKASGDQLSAIEYTDCTSQEAQNFVLDSGQALSGATDTQMVQGALRYQASGNEYVESGAVNNYVLTSKIPEYVLDAYIDGMKVQFLATHTNTGAIDVDVNGLGVKTVVLPDTSPVTTGTVIDENYISFIYDLSTDEFIYVSSTNGTQNELSAYKDEVAAQSAPTGTTLIGTDGETLKSALDSRPTSTVLAATNDPTGATKIGKIDTGVNIGTGANAQVFFSKFVGMALINQTGLIFGNNLTVTVIGTAKYRFNFKTNLSNTNYVVLIQSERITTGVAESQQNIQVVPNTRTTSSFQIQSVANSATEPEFFHKAWVYVIQH